MTLVGSILKSVKCKNAKSRRKYTSPPPELEEGMPIKRRKPFDRYGHVRAVVDSAPPRYDPWRLSRNLPEWKHRVCALYRENMMLLAGIKWAHIQGRVDSRWTVRPQGSLQYHQRRCDFYKRVHEDNLAFYKRILDTEARVDPTARLRRDWAHNRQQILRRAQGEFVLFPPVPRELVEDPAFLPPPGVKRPRVYLTLRIKNWAVLGELKVELFTDVCPNTCKLFLELLDGDCQGYGYVGTCFFRKVPGLYWSGGDVVHDNGCGCYAQRGRRVPIGAENYHFPHSMPGLLSMKVTRDDEMCGIFNITFKPLPQFDLHNVVFGRIIRPSSTYSSLVTLGVPLSSQPVVELMGTRRREGHRWVRGVHNSKVARTVQRIHDL